MYYFAVILVVIQSIRIANSFITQSQLRSITKVSVATPDGIDNDVEAAIMKQLILHFDCDELDSEEISELLFEPLDFGVAAQIQSEIRTTIRNYEPRIGIVELVVEPEYEQNSFSVHMEYEIVGRQDNAPQEINFLLQRTQ